MSDLEEKPDHQGCSAGQVDDSGTSSSSVLNGEALADVADEASCSTRPPAAFEFCILKSRSTSAEGENEVEEEIEGDGISGVPQQPRLITWQLFPPASVAPGVSQQSMLASSSPSFCQADAPSEEQQELQQQVKPVRKRRRGPQSRSSQYRGVTFYRRTGRWESHIWDCGKQLYLGGFDTAHAAARAYDRAAIRFRGVHADINFNLSDYEEDLKLMKDLSKEEFIYILRRQSSGVATGRSKYRGATLHMCGRWQAGMEQSPGKNAYDKAAAAVKCNGRKAVTNAEPRVYEAELFSVADTEGLDVDLSLRISQPVVHSPKGGQNPLVRQFEASYAGKSKKRPEVVLQAPPIWCPGTNRPSPFPLLSSASASASKVIAALPSLQSPPSPTRYLHFSQQATLNQYLKNRNQ